MSEALNVIKNAVSAAKSEQAALNKVVFGLAATRYTSKPTVGTAKLDGVNLRVYHWSNTPLGDLLLFTGAGLETSVLVAASELDHTPRNGMIYIPVSLSDPAAKAGQKKLESILSGKRVAQITKKAAAEGAPKAPKPAAQRVVRPAKPAAAKAAKVEVVDELEARRAFLRSPEARAARERGWERSRADKAVALKKSTASSEKQELIGGLKDLVAMLG